MQDDEISVEAPLEKPEDASATQEVGAQEASRPPRRKSRSQSKPQASAPLEKFLKDLEEIKDVEAKLEFVIAFMKEAIAQEKGPDFKAFWEARIKALALFKENMAPFARAPLWNTFSELSKEARRLKDMLDEQSDFAAEQIDIAITAIEKELDGLSETVQAEKGHYVPEGAYALKNRFDFYNATQHELALLNLSAARITSLRKELIKTEMRIRSKNKFFERLSKAGDRVFPRRKELIQEISQAFIEDVDHFIQAHFSTQESRISLFDLRDEIKALQAAAKIFTLNTQGFSHARLKLSDCWDKLKEKDKERKVEFDKRREEYQKNRDELKNSLDLLTLRFESGESSPNDTLSGLDDIVRTMRNKELGRDEVKELRGLVSALQETVQGKLKFEETERLKHEEERLNEKRQLIQSFNAKFHAFLAAAKTLSSDEIGKQKEALFDEVQKTSLSKSDRNELEKILKPLKDLLREKKEQALLSLPADDQLALLQLKELLQSKREQRQEIKEQLEHYRKLVGSSGLDFQKGLEYNAQISDLKEKFERAQSQVREVEEKIGQLEDQLSG